MGKQINDFIVESLGRCFLCMGNITRDRDFNPPISEPELEPLSSSSITSLQYLANYLKMDLKKVFNDGETIPLKLLSRVEKSNLKVFLCNNCVNISTKLDKLIQKLEKIQLEIKSDLETFQSKLIEWDDGIDDTNLFVQPKCDIYPNSGLRGKLEIMKILRSEAKQKCSIMLAKVAPRVKIKKLTGNEIITQMETNQNYSLLRNHKKYISNAKDILKLDEDAASVPNIKLESNSPNNFGYPKGNDYNEDSTMDTDRDYDDQPHSEVSSSTEEYLDGESADNSTSVKKSPHVTTKTISAVNSTAKLKYVINPESGKYKCQICSKEVGAREALRRHFRTTHLKVKYPCKFKHCMEEFRHNTSRLRHYQVVHARIKFKCLKCNKLLSDKSNLTRHLKTCLVRHAHN